MMLYCVSCRVGSLHLLGSSFEQNLHKNDPASACIKHFIYILVLEDVIGSDVGDGFFWPTL